MVRSWMKVVALRPVAKFLYDSGIEPAEFVHHIGLPLLSILEADLWVDRDRIFELSLKLADLSGDAFATMHLSQLNDLSHFGRWGEGILRSQDLAGAINYAAENISLIETGRRLSLARNGNRVRFQSEFLNDISEDPHQLLDGTLMWLHKIVHQACEEVPVEAHIAHDKPRDTSEYERLLGPNLVFGADASAVVFDADALSLPLQAQLPGANGRPRRLCAPDVVQSVVRAVDDIIEFERPSALAVASSLGITLRTMQRNLKAWGTTYEELLTEYLILHAAHELRSKHFSVTDVAFNLGYSDSGHFTRAFKRWTGYTPRDFQVEEEIPVSTLQSLILESDVATLH